jgi:hypothetical protein
MQLNKFLRFFIIPILALVFLKCNDEPTSVGADLLPADDKIQFQQLDTKETPINQTSSFYEAKIKLGTSPYIILGKNSNLESVILMQFSPAFSDSMIFYYKSNKVKIKKAWMELKPAYKLGDETQNFDFTLHQIRKNWTSTGFDKDSLALLKYDSKNVASSLIQTDTLLTFDVEPAVVEQWLKYRIDTLSAPRNYGLFMKPTANTQRFVGFIAFGETISSSLPTLKIQYEQNTKSDSLFSTPYMDVHVVSGSFPTQTNFVYLQGGLPLRGVLAFDLSSLPKDIIINSAKLELTIDTLKSLIGKPLSDSISVRALKDSVTKKVSDSLVVSILKRNKNVYSGEITWLIQKWISATDPNDNQGLTFSLTDEERSVARLAVYGSNAHDLLNRPRLKIVYIQKK